MEDVRRLKQRKERRRNPEAAVEGALHWGTPVMESGITLISDGRLYYRGRDVLELASRFGIEEVAALIWTGDPVEASRLFPAHPELSSRVRGAFAGVGGLGPVERCQVLLPLAGAGDAVAYDLRPAAVARTGARILGFLASVAAGGEENSSGVAETLRLGWGVPDEEAATLIDAALILCADHELPVSTFAARCVASAGATPYAVVEAGLAALGGVRHGGQVELVEAFLRETEAEGDARAVIAGRLRRGDGVPGFGHSLYPDGDPRGAELLRLVAETYPEDPAGELCRAVAREVLDLIGESPTVDFGLVAVGRVLGAPPGGAVALFALGRTVGWIGHAIEQYESGSLIRPRARYVGEQPYSG